LAGLYPKPPPKETPPQAESPGYLPRPDISQEFGFGRPFCPAAAFSAKKILAVLFKYASGSF
jgi:hypothetical protein